MQSEACCSIHEDLSKIVKVVVGLSVPYVKVFHTFTHYDYWGEGSGHTYSEALEGSLIEAAERHYLTLYDDAEITHGTFRQLVGNAVCPEEFVLFSPHEYSQVCDKYVKYTQDLRLGWIQATEILHDCEQSWLVPASIAILRYSKKFTNERIAPTLSSGGCAAPTVKTGILKGIYELLERDAFAITWLNKLSMPQFNDLDNLDQPTRDAIYGLQSDGFMVNFIDITTDLGIPVVLCAISRNDSLAANREMALGLGSRLCIHSAAEHALKEAVEQLVNYFKFSDAKIEYTERSCKLMEESTFDYFKFSHFLIANSVSSENRGGRSGEVSEAEELNFCMTRLWEKKLRIFYLDRTPKDLLSTSFRLIRVLVTKLQPHVYELDCNRLANARLYEAPVQMKVFTKPKSPGELNYRPDPYTFIQFSEAVK